MDGTSRPTPIFVPEPAAVAASQLTAFTRFCGARTGQRFPHHGAFHQFSVEEFRQFWRCFLEWADLPTDGDPRPVCTSDDCEQASFFPNLRLNYAECLLRGRGDDDRPALTACNGDLAASRLTRAELRARAMRGSAALHALGIAPGDRVVAVAGNTAETAVAALAVTALGAVFATSAPEMGAASLVARFGQLAPTLLLCHLQSPQSGAPRLVAERIAEIAAALPSLRAVVALDDGPTPGCRVPVLRWSEMMAAASDVAPPWPRLPFNHPCFILFSSGTTGRPKCLVHGIGGTIIEHAKEHRLHCDLRPGDKLLFHTSTGWMMWHWQLSALASGAEIVLFDGPLADPGALWRIVSREQVTMFGTSPAYLQLCEHAGLAPGRELCLDALRAVLSTGAVLHDRQFDWVMANVKHAPLQSISGGTDIIGCFVLGNPNLPVYRGEMQCRSLGLDVQAQNAGAADRGFGELVCRNPFPSRPLGLYGDADGSRFHAAYFEQNPGVWTHGDFIELTGRGTARIHGRSDGVINVRGIRIGPAEIYRILRALPEIRDAVAVEQENAGDLGGSRLVLLVILREGIILDGALTLRIKKAVGRHASPAHVPDVIAQVRALPLTHSGKLSERAVSDALNRRAVGNLEALRNPDCLDAIVRHPALAFGDRRQALPSVGAVLVGLPLVAQLQAMWENVFGIVPIGLDDNFFDLGGRSLLAFILFTELSKLIGRTVPLTTIFEAPTIRDLAARLQDENLARTFSCLVCLSRQGGGRPLFIMHGFGGNVLELAKPARFLHADRPVYALQARGLDPAQEPHDRIEDMAAHYLGEIRAVQPHGPYALAGFSTGGLIAFEIARRLVERGEPVEFVGLLDTEIHESNLSTWRWMALQLRRTLHVIGRLRFISPAQGLAYVQRMARLMADQVRLRKGGSPHQRVLHEDLLPPHFVRVRDAGRRAFVAYRPGPYPGTVTLFRARDRHPLACDPLPLWRAAAAEVTVVEVPGSHVTFIEEPNVQVLGDEIARRLSGRTGIAQPSLARQHDII